MTTAKAGTGRAENDDNLEEIDSAESTAEPAENPAEPGPPRRPHADSLELGALSGAVPSARLHARFVLQEWGLDRLADSTELVVSELVTNAVRATRHAGLDDPVRVSLLADDASVLVVVSDSNPDPPRPRRAAEAEEAGRGLMVVETVSDWWDWKPARGGKLVRALVGAP